MRIFILLLMLATTGTASANLKAPTCNEYINKFNSVIDAVSSGAPNPKEIIEGKSSFFWQVYGITQGIAYGIFDEHKEIDAAQWIMYLQEACSDKQDDDLDLSVTIKVVLLLSKRSNNYTVFATDPDMKRVLPADHPKAMPRIIYGIFNTIVFKNI